MLTEGALLTARGNSKRLAVGILGGSQLGRAEYEPGIIVLAGISSKVPPRIFFEF